jgi:predicted translin family RNA/ssDNA-binding protein
MRRNVREDIRTLEDEVISEENKIIELLHKGEHDKVEKSLAKIHSALKYVSILANGAPIDEKEDIRIMGFLRVHYQNLQKLSLPA